MLQRPHTTNKNENSGESKLNQLLVLRALLDATYTIKQAPAHKPHAVFGINKMTD